MQDDQIRRHEGVGHVAHSSEMTNSYRVFMRKLEAKKSFRISIHKWENIKNDLKEKYGRVWYGVI
jgi:hypothetical protein